MARFLGPAEPDPTLQEHPLGSYTETDMRIYYGAMKRCPTAAMEVLFELKPVHLIVDEAAKFAILRTSIKGIGRGKSMEIRERESLLELGLLLDSSNDGVTRKYRFEMKVHMDLGNKQERE